ncbi:MAG TPA: MBL fold metallo-hydrolase [Xanthomonadaceae bacterium]|nr:MBL fold metallo-hydrolase [Xanthomonadaceae bacterium]
MRHAPWIAALLAIPLLALAQQDMSKVQIKTTALRGGTHLLTGAGGNIVASAGSDGVFIIDDQFAPLSGRIRAALDKLGPGPVRFVINTHWHGDHTGGNEALGKAGAVIVAHDNVRKRMRAGQMLRGDMVPAAPGAALPVLTFGSEASLHLNGDDVRMLHVARAHTDGDALVKFERANVLHMGDVYFNGLYPFIDAESGGSIGGVLAAVERGLALSDANTIVVPGHGPGSNRAGLAAYGAMLKGHRDRIAALKRKGRTLAQVIAARPTAATDEALGKAFIKPDALVTSIYNTL